uniref:Glutamate decarboxylase like 1 n=1 Tax=Anabas testudineus TaxID=64144 RepID=A0A7N6APH9_ANATE
MSVHSDQVCEWRSPEQLKELLDLELRDKGESESRVLQYCRDAIKYSVKTTHPRFFNQLYAGMDPYSMVGSFITEAITTSLYTYEVAPVFTLMEDTLLRKMIEMIGWDEGGDGIFNPGGSMSNMYAVNLARYRYCPDIKEVGLFAAKRLVILTSQEGHYSISKGAALLGIGTKNVYIVSSDKRGKMIPSALEEKIKLAKSEGAVPFMVNATAGTTVLGAFDPIEEIADICEKYNLWLHVDVRSYIHSPTNNVSLLCLLCLLRVNSVAWNLHKMLMVPLQCSAFLVRDKTSLLQHCHSARATYLFQQDKFYDVSYDTGDKSVQCGRKPDAFKFWLMWKALGTTQLEQIVDRAIAMARYLAQEIKKREEFQLVIEVAPVVKERMMKKGSMMIGYQAHGDKPNFFRMVVISPQVSREDLNFVLDEIHNLGQDL